eukprot:5061511-Karenia_brevis.AAC.1
MIWDGQRKNIGMVQKIYGDGRRECIGIEIENLLGWTCKMYWDGPGKRIRMTGLGPGPTPGEGEVAV